MSIISPDFRSICVGDLNLIECIVTDDGVACQVLQRRKSSAPVRRLRIGAGNRRVYHARIVGCQDTIFTAVVYDGPYFARVCPIQIFSPLTLDQTSCPSGWQRL
jgi:hypothetical protein